MKSSSHPGMELVTVQVFFSRVIINTTTRKFLKVLVYLVQAEQGLLDIINFSGSFDQELKINNNNNKTVPSHPHNHEVG